MRYIPSTLTALAFVAWSLASVSPAAADGGDSSSAPHAQDAERAPAPSVDGCTDVTLHAELGYLAVLAHEIQLGRAGTTFDYVSDGGQDVLFPFVRLSADMVLSRVHQVTFLWQPLSLSGRTVLKRDHVIDDITFPQGTAVDTTYSFPFWRVSYAYDFIDDPRHEAALGVSFQLRNATIDFTSADGALRISNRNIGPVPIIRFRGRTQLDNGLWLGTEIDGLYAPISVLNGSNSEVTGAIIDASVRVGMELRHDVSGFLNVRYLAGGSVGESNSDDELYGDGYARNWLHFLTVSLGLSADLL